ncbi:MAG: ribonuclease HII [Candidatus Muiribacteriota bacterium]
MRHYEKSIFEKYGFNLIAGIDEVGRGPLAGPVVASAVIFPHDYINNDINDSKKLSAKKREILFTEIINNCIAYSIVEINNSDIDRLNIHQATKTAMEKAVNNLQIKPDFILTDFMKINSKIPQINLIKGDSKSISIAGASILAKVYRDNLMKKMAELYPDYGFEKNMGYGTKKHIEALNNSGFCKIHRKSFSPVKEMVKSVTKTQGSLFE